MSDFELQAAAALGAISRAIEASGLDCEIAQKGDGVLDIELENGTRLIINRHGPAQEIWVAAKSGGYHFRQEGSAWINTRDGGELLASLSRYLSEQSGTPVMLRCVLPESLKLPRD